MGLANDLYGDTAPLAPAVGALRSDTRAMVAIVGAGLTGLSTALHLARAGIDTAVIEAHSPGWGAGGRNGGQVNAGLKHEPDAVAREFGPERGERLTRFAGAAPDYLFRLVEELGIRCEAERGGTVRAACHPRQFAALELSVAAWRQRGTTLRMLDKGEATALTGTDRYGAALFDPRGGSINPLAYARGLATAALQAGARIHGDTPATGLERDGESWIVRTPAASLRAGQLVIATDGYSGDLWPGLRSSIVPVYSSIIASEPLPLALAGVMPTRAVLYEVGNVTVYYRRDAAGRLLIGGRGVQRPACGLGDFSHLMAYAERLWPALAGARWTHGWNGQFALTPDFYPRLHAPAPGVLIALGYSGRGVALATALGRELAAAASGTPLDELPLPVTPIRPIPFHRWWRVGVTLGVAAGRVRDRLGI